MRSVLTIILVLSFASVHAEGDAWVTRSGYYRVSFESELEPLEINKIHSWIFIVETPGGEPVEDATISITGGMPLHNHGLPTDPKMTAEIGGGRYRVEGMRFHMNGEWELTVTIDVEGRRDTVVIPLTL